MKHIRVLCSALALSVLSLMPMSALAIDKEQKLLRKHDCNKCHAVSKKKDGPSFKEIAEKYRDDTTALETLYAHITTEQTVEVDGKEEIHKPIEIDDRKQVEDILRWILSK